MSTENHLPRRPTEPAERHHQQENAGPSLPLGRVVLTPGALELLQETDTQASSLVKRHASGDWGELSREDAGANEDALEQGLRILSAYPVGEDGGRVWIITEADRSSTCLLLPDEY